MAVSSTATSLVGGFPQEIFDGGFDHKFVCAYCKKILRDARQHFCGHRFCLGCIQHIFSESAVADRHGSSLHCPACMEEGVPAEVLKLDNMFPDNAVKREMVLMDTQCANIGCTWKGKFRDYTTHESQCEFRPVACRQCGALVPPNKVIEHQQKECANRTNMCKHCNANIVHNNLEGHNQTCPKYPIKCDGCGKKKIPRDQLEEHVNRECNKRVILCPVGCPEQMNLDKFVQHLTINKNAGTHLLWVMDKLMQLEKQINNSITASTSRGDLTQLMATINDLDQKVQEMQRQSQPSDDTQTVTARLQATETKVSSFEPIMGVLHKEIVRCLQVIEALERNQTAAQQKVEQLGNQVEQMEQKVRAVERSVALKDIQFAEHDMRMQCMELASYDGSLLWRITDISRKRQEAITGKVTSLYSPAFFTGKVGYKMCARIYLNGDGMGKSSHISLFFVVMRGHYDALLPWPFQQKVSLMMIDQNFRENMVDTFRPDPSSSSFRRPATEMNIASGCPLFLPLSILNDTFAGYVKDDVMFVKLIVDTEGLDKATEYSPQKGSGPSLVPSVKK